MFSAGGVHQDLWECRGTLGPVGTLGWEPVLLYRKQLQESWHRQLSNVLTFIWSNLELYVKEQLIPECVPFRCSSAILQSLHQTETARLLAQAEPGQADFVSGLIVLLFVVAQMTLLLVFIWYAAMFKFNMLHSGAMHLHAVTVGPPATLHTSAEDPVDGRMFITRWINSRAFMTNNLFRTRKAQVCGNLHEIEQYIVKRKTLLLSQYTQVAARQTYQEKIKILHSFYFLYFNT